MNQAAIPDNSISYVFVARLNKVLCNIWRAAPGLTMTAMLVKENPDWSLNRANEAAQAAAVVPELPTCAVSDNEDGRTNVSWYCGDEGISCFYTVDAEGTAVCKEYPDEELDLSDYETMACVAATIYCDLTLNKHDSDGVQAALHACIKHEPEWKGDTIFPTNLELRTKDTTSPLQQKETMNQAPKPQWSESQQETSVASTDTTKALKMWASTDWEIELTDEHTGGYADVIKAIKGLEVVHPNADPDEWTYLARFCTVIAKNIQKDMLEKAIPDEDAPSVVIYEYTKNYSELRSAFQSLMDYDTSAELKRLEPNIEEN